jgi:hypothetical protein
MFDVLRSVIFERSVTLAQAGKPNFRYRFEFSTTVQAANLSEQSIFIIGALKFRCIRLGSFKGNLSYIFCFVLHDDSYSDAIIAIRVVNKVAAVVIRFFIVFFLFKLFKVGKLNSVFQIYDIV